MPGSADRNLRKAAYQEDLGVVSLSAFCAVAPVPRPQDVGVDVVCTLLRPDGSRRLVAEESFYVQLKADSKNSVGYKGEKLFGSVNFAFPSSSAG